MRDGAADGVVSALPVSDTIKVAENGAVSETSTERSCTRSRPRRPSGSIFFAESTPPPKTASAPRPTTPRSSRRPEGVYSWSMERRPTSSYLTGGPDLAEAILEARAGVPGTGVRG